MECSADPACAPAPAPRAAFGAADPGQPCVKTPADIYDFICRGAAEPEGAEPAPAPPKKTVSWAQGVKGDDGPPPKAAPRSGFGDGDSPAFTGAVVERGAGGDAAPPEAEAPPAPPRKVSRFKMERMQNR